MAQERTSVPFLLYCFPMIDTHCHVHVPAYASLEELLTRARQKNVRMITIGTNAQTSREAVAVAEQYPDIWCTVGLHPNYTHASTTHTDAHEVEQTQAESFDPEYYRALITQSTRVVAIGEVGLDYYRLPEHGAQEVIAAQMEAVRAAITLATEVDLPLVLHVRDAHADMIKLLTEAIDQGQLARRAVVHCFTGTREDALAYHALGVYTSFTGIVTFRDKKHPERNTPIMEVVAALPLAMLMIETDAPYLAPEPHRGQQNEPWMVCFVAQKIAELHGISVEEVERVTTSTAETFFRLTNT